jgi:NADP-dependent aldehyde dehydrogenase
LEPVLLSGCWTSSVANSGFRAVNPKTEAPLAAEFPISPWSEVDRALSAAALAFEELRDLSDEPRARFLAGFADRIDADADRLVALAHEETALPVEPRLRNVELPRTSNQLRQAAEAVRSSSWRLPTIDTKAGIRSVLEPIGPVAVFGPNNFPFAFNSVAGGDFAAAIAAGCPVIAKANSSHPGVTKRLAELALEAVQAAELPVGTVQLLYRLDHADGERFVADRRLGSIGYTGARGAGLTLKAAADAVGKPIYLELSSVNPVVILPGALAERGEELAKEFQGSCLMGTGQFCTNPGLILLVDGPDSRRFLDEVTELFRAAPVGTLLSAAVREGMVRGVATLTKAGATLRVGGTVGGGAGCSFANTLLTVNAARFLADPHAFQTEVFGNCSLAVIAANLDEAMRVIAELEGSLTGSIYSARGGADDAAVSRVARVMRPKVGRLLNDKMPTGVAVSPAMNHGGPFPSTGHPHFTAVGIPASIRRFTTLACYDAVRPERLPPILRDAAPDGEPWRLIDGAWTRAAIGLSAG